VLLTGRVIGMPTLTGTDPELGTPVDGIGFAIPANTIVRIARQLITKGKVTSSGRASLNIQGETHVNSEHQPDGVAVRGVMKGSATAKAGIRSGDVIVGVAGQPTPDVETLDNVLAQFKPGHRVKVEVLRGGNPQEVMVRLGDIASPSPAHGKSAKSAKSAKSKSPSPGGHTRSPGAHATASHSPHPAHS
jgi:S1-C subfamily serine protease